MAAYLKTRVSDETAKGLLADSVLQYTKIYNIELAKFYRNTEDRISGYEDLMEEMEDTTGEELGQMNTAIQNVRNTEAATPQFGEDVKPAVGREIVGGTWIYKVPIVGPIIENVDFPIVTPLIANEGYLEHKEFSAKTKEAFLKQFVPSLGVQYFNLPRQEQNLSEREFDEYGDLSKDFQDGMGEYVNAQLDLSSRTAKTRRR